MEEDYFFLQIYPAQFVDQTNFQDRNFGHGTSMETVFFATRNAEVAVGDQHLLNVADAFIIVFGILELLIGKMSCGILPMIQQLHIC